ncbi:MAG: hypothetical protein ACE5OW_06870 [Candidatus Bathyarchaeia archaeon]
MSSLESRIKDIEDLYYKLRSILKTRYILNRQIKRAPFHLSEDLRRKSGELSDAFIIGLAKFQRDLEFIFEDAKKLEDAKTKPYIERMSSILDEIMYLTSSVRMGRHDLYPRVRAELDKNFSNVYESFQDREWDKCIYTFNYIQGEMYEFLADLRLLYRLRIFPYERKAEIRDKLSNLKFMDVYECLLEADDNVIAGPKHYKDCADRCREALEKLVNHLTIKIEEKPSKFELNMTHLQKRGVFEVPTKLEIVAFYTYLGQVGPHGMLKKKLSDGDVNYIMDETYRKISRLLENLRIIPRRKTLNKPQSYIITF